MLCARIAHRARGLVSALFAPLPQEYSLGLRNLSNDRNKIQLGDVLDALIKGSSPANEDRIKRLTIISDLQKSLSKAQLGPTIDVRVLPFGSFVNSLYEPNSDLDLAIVGQIVVTDDLSPDDKRYPFTKIHLAKLPSEYATELLRTAVAQFVKDGLADTKSMVPVLHARVPIVKFVHPATGINVDVCLGSEGDAFKTWSLAQLMAVHPVVEKLCRLVKIWARAQGINDPRAFTFNSWCLNLLVVFFLQRHATPELLPPLKALMYDYVGHPGAMVRLMHGGRQPPNRRILQLMGHVTKNAGPARETYGRRSAKPLEQLFLDFLESNSGLLKAALANKEPLTRGTGISVFYGDFHRERHFRGHMLFVEDPLNDLDNTARTLRVPKDSSGRTIDYVTKAFTASAKHLRAHLEGTSQLLQARTSSPGASQGQPEVTVVDAASSNTAGPQAVSPGTTASAAEADVQSQGPPPAEPSSSAASAARATPPPSPAASSNASSSVAAKVVFLFGTELLSRLPDLSAQLLGPELSGWARDALAAGRPAGEVHEELLQKMGVAGDFESFVTFKKRCRLRMLDEEEHWTPEELELLITKQVKKKVRLEREAAKKARERRAEAARKQRRNAYRDALKARKERFHDNGVAQRNGEIEPRANDPGQGVAKGASAESQVQQGMAGAKPPHGASPSKPGPRRSGTATHGGATAERGRGAVATGAGSR